MDSTDKDNAAVPMTKEEVTLAAMKQVQAVYEDKCATINGRDYVFTITSHAQRVKIFAFYSKVQPLIEQANMSFIDTKEFEQVMAVIGNIVTFDGSLLGRRATHWDEYPEDFLSFVSIAMPVISYPFLRGKTTD